MNLSKQEIEMQQIDEDEHKDRKEEEKFNKHNLITKPKINHKNVLDL